MTEEEIRELEDIELFLMASSQLFEISVAKDEKDCYYKTRDVLNDNSRDGILLTAKLLRLQNDMFLIEREIVRRLNSPVWDEGDQRKRK